MPAGKRVPVWLTRLGGVDEVERVRVWVAAGKRD